MPIVALMILCINKLHYQIGDEKNLIVKNKKTSPTSKEEEASRNNVIRYDGSTENIPKNITTYFFKNANNVTIEIAKSKELETHGKIIIRAFGQNCKIHIGKNFKLRGKLLIELGGKDNSIYIGDDCLFADDVTIFSTDFHRIYDKNNKLLNPPQPVTIEDNCWIGRHVKILKGSHNPKNSAVGICSVVNKKFDKQNILLAGTPAKIIKEDIYWKE